MLAIALKSTLCTLASVLGSLAICWVAAVLTGTRLDGIGLALAIICPLAMSFPISAVLFWQADRIRVAKRDVERAHAELRDAYDVIRTRSRLDWLTGALNRGTFVDELARVSRRGETGALLYIDIDHFKRINDINGHATGDAALVQTVRSLQDGLGRNDILGRIGGEEFAAFVLGCGEEAVMAKAEMMLAAVRATKVRSQLGREVPITASVGAVHCGFRFDVDQMLRRADAAMYRAKRDGRSRAVAA